MRGHMTITARFCALGLAAAALTAACAPGPAAAAAVPLARFLDAHGRFDLAAARRSGYEGALDLGASGAAADPRSAASADPNDGWATIFTPQGVNGVVLALALYNGQVIVGGTFTSAGDIAANGIAA